MKLAPNHQSLDELQILLKNRFLEFNQQHPRLRGRRYPPELRELICQGRSAGLRQVDIQRLTGMSLTAIKHALKEAKRRVVAPRRLEVVAKPDEHCQTPRTLTVRLPSGVTIELADVKMLTVTLLASLSSLEASNATTC